MTSSLRHRGRAIHVDTTQSAEIEIKGYQISDQQLEKAAQRLRAMPIGPLDIVAGDLRAREIDGYDYIFFIGLSEHSVVVTISSVMPHEASRTSDVLKKLGKVAILRGATGI